MKHLYYQGLELGYFIFSPMPYVTFLGFVLLQSLEKRHNIDLLINYIIFTFMTLAFVCLYIWFLLFFKYHMFAIIVTY